LFTVSIPRKLVIEETANPIQVLTQVTQVVTYAKYRRIASSTESTNTVFGSTM
jgi:hypothetical protein